MEELESLEHEEYMIFDFSKAFDTVDHAVLLETLYQYVIGGTMIDCPNNYLFGRWQYLTSNNVCFCTQTVPCGVP